MNEQLLIKEAKLQSILRGYDSLAVAFSGGVDSTLLLDVAYEVLGEKAVAITACMFGLPARELNEALVFCKERGIRHIPVDFDEFAVAGFAENPPDRCYLCKRELLTLLLDSAEKLGLSVLAEGSNLDDEDDYRPGKRAVEELDVASPLLQAGFTKVDIRALSQERGLPTWDKPACACLSTRLPYGTPLSKELLGNIGEAEQCIFDLGAKQVRVRVHDDLARIEVDEASIPLFLALSTREHISSELQRLGFDYVTLDLQGYRVSGGRLK